MDSSGHRRGASRRVTTGVERTAAVREHAATAEVEDGSAYVGAEDADRQAEPCGQTFG